MYHMIKRTFDITLSLLLLLILAVPMLIVALLIKVTSKGPAIYWSQRIGYDSKIFLMPKFRSMATETPQVATHLLSGAKSYITPVGAFIRKTSIDELPQIYSVLTGKMSFIGPRPALYNQDDLIEMRKKLGVDKMLPGITGWAQVNGRDELPIPDKVQLDAYYLQNQSVILDVKILFMTFLKVILSKNVTH